MSMIFNSVIWVFNVVIWKLVVKHGKKTRVALGSFRQIILWEEMRSNSNMLQDRNKYQPRDAKAVVLCAVLLSPVLEHEG